MKGLLDMLVGKRALSTDPVPDPVPVKELCTPVAQVPKPKVGQLLLDSGLISSAQLHLALRHSVGPEQSVVKTIVFLKFASDRDVRSATIVQELIVEGRVEERIGLLALRLSNERNIAVGAAIQELLATGA